MIESENISPILYSLITLGAQNNQLIAASVKAVIQFCKDTSVLMSLKEDHNVVDVANPILLNPNTEVKETGIIDWLLVSIL